MRERVKLHLELGRAYREKGDYASALQELKFGLKHSPSDGRIHLEMGRTYRQMKEGDLAVDEFKKVLQFNLDTDEIHLELGRIYKEKKEYTLALKELDSALSHNPSDSHIHLELGQVYREMKDYNTAIEEFKKTLELGLDSENVHIGLSSIYREKEEYTLALKELESALSHNPSDGRIHLELGWIYRDMKDYDLAMEELEKAIAFGIDTEEIHTHLARMYRQVGKYNLSANEFKKILEISPHRNEAFFKNKMLNEIEISQRKVLLQSKPRGLGITLTTKCNLRCMMCGIWKDNWEIPKKTIQEIISLFPYLERIVWQGGEVFLLNYFEELFEKAATYPNLKQSIITNGLLIDEKWAERLARENVAIIYSIDAITKDGYEYIIGRRARFEDLIRSIKLVNEYRKRHDCHKDPFNKMTTIINVVVMKSNYRYLEKFVDFATEYKFDEIQFTPILGIRGQENIFSNKDREAGEYFINIMPEISKKAQDCGIVLNNWLPPILTTEKTIVQNKEQRDVPDFNCSSKKNKEMICYLPWQQMFMTPDRKLKPGCYCSIEIGDVNKSSLMEIWNGTEMQLYREKLSNDNYGHLCSSMCISGVIPKEELRFER